MACFDTLLLFFLVRGARKVGAVFFFLFWLAWGRWWVVVYC